MEEVTSALHIVLQCPRQASCVEAVREVARHREGWPLVVLEPERLHADRAVARQERDRI